MLLHILHTQHVAAGFNLSEDTGPISYRQTD